MESTSPVAYATFATRAIALTIDTAICVAVGVVAGAALNFGLGAWIGFAFSFLYFGECEGVVGQTFGKWLTRVRVVDAASGEPIGVPRGLLRHTGRLASYVVLGVGFVSMLDDRQRQTWHDKLVNSVVCAPARARDAHLTSR